jgi:hypothetical protein
MGLGDPGNLSLGQYAAITRGWARAHGHAKLSAPSEDEFEAAVLRKRGAA